MQIRVGTTVTQPGPTTIPSSLPGRAADLSNPVKTRFITLNEVAAETADWFLNLNAAGFSQGPSEQDPNPAAGTVEDWVYINMTGDTHPMHTHLVTFQVVGRTPFDVAAYQADVRRPERRSRWDRSDRRSRPGRMLPPDPTERGFKDTVKVNPGYFTTIRAKFDLPNGVSAPQTYVHHCHIVEHEDNDMMQRFTVT